MVDSCHESALHGRERSSPGELVQAARALPGAVHSDIVAAQCRFNIIQRVTDLRRKLMRYIKHYNKTARPIRWAYADPSRRIA